MEARPFAPRVRQLLALGSLCLAASCTCGKPQLVATLPPGVRVDTYSQQAASKIDVLWIIDDSGSMAPRQENLARNFHAFIDEFTRNAVDYRLAVTTTDIFKEAGRFVGSPAILTPQTPGVLDAFAANVRVGVNGSPYEVGMEAARLSLVAQQTANAGQVAACKAACTGSTPGCVADCGTKAVFPFLRTDAYLYLVLVSDEDDKSAQDVGYFHRTFEDAKGIGNDATVSTAAIMGDVPSNGCGATPGLKYQALSALTGGAVGSICDANFSSTLKKLASNAVGLKRKFALQAAPNVPTLEVSLKYPCNVDPSLVAACASVDRSACDGQPVDSVAVLCTPVAGGDDGWSYEEANRVVYFAGDSVPGLSAEIDLQYYEAGTGP